jgi:hypothetical protein
MSGRDGEPQRSSKAALFVPGVGERNSTTWNAVAFQQQMAGSLSLLCSQGKPKPRAERKPRGTQKLRFHSEKQQKPDEEYVLGSKPQPLTLAQKLGLTDQPTAPLTDTQWATAKAKSNARNDSSLPCVICKEPFAYQQQVLLSCSHVFHHACLSSFERFTGKKTCPLCRKEDYEKRVIHEGAKAHRLHSAILIQSTWRGYRVRKWYRLVRKSLPPNDPKLRKKFFEEKLKETNNLFIKKVEETESAVVDIIRDIDKSITHSRQIFRTFDAVIGQPMNGKGERLGWETVKQIAIQRRVNECPICIMALDTPLSQPGWSVPHPGITHRHPRNTVLLSCSHAFHEPCFEMFEKFCTHTFDTVCPVCRSPYSKRIIHVVDD